MKTILFFISISILITGCCTKMECYCDDEFEISFFKEQYLVDNFVDFQLIITEKNNLDSIIDSTILYYDYHNPNIAKFYSIGYNRERKDYSYLIINRDFNIADTIDYIKYDYDEYLEECNECFPNFYKDLFVCKRLKNFKISINGKLYDSPETSHMIK